MKKMLVVLGVLAVFSLTLTPVYPLENSTWGLIKATFSESPNIVSGDFQLLTHSAFQSVLAKPVLDEKVSKLIKAGKGGKVKLDLKWVKMEVRIKKNALERDMKLALYVEQDDDGVPCLFVEGSEHQACDPSATLKIKFKVSLADGLDPNSLTLMHQINRGDGWDMVGGFKTKVGHVDKKNGTAEVEAEMKLHGFSKYTAELVDGFSRYALAASR